MKELSIEQKAEAYDEALERAKRMFSDKELYYLFPELVESEDEKIRKSLIALVMWAKSYSASGVTREDAETMMDWLKSLRPQKQWKPSEEIMKGLNEIINKLAISPVIHEHGYLYDLMVNLRKKLTQ